MGRQEYCNISDEKLVNLYRESSDGQAFSELWERYRKRIRRMWQTLDRGGFYRRHLADFESLFDKLLSEEIIPRFDSKRASFERFLLRVCQRRGLTLYKKLACRERREQLLVSELARTSRDTYNRRSASSQILSDLDQMRSGLPAEFQKLLELRYGIFPVGFSEIAEIMAMAGYSKTPSGWRDTHSRCIKQLYNSLRDKGYGGLSAKE